jgi:hypothetical protein
MVLHETVSSMQFFYKKALKVSVFFSFITGILFFLLCKMFQGQAKEKRHLNPIFCIRADELISKMESKLQKYFFMI